MKAALGQAVRKLKGSAGLQRLLPDTVALKVALLVGNLRARFSSTRRERVGGDLSFLLDGAPGPGPTDAMVRRRIVEESVTNVLDWRPSRLAALDVIGLANLHQAQARGHGLIVLFLHVGTPAAIAYAIGRRVAPFHMLGGDWIFNLPSDPFIRSMAVHRRRWVEDHGGTWVQRGGSFARLEGALKDGGTAVIAFDSAGSVPTPLAGKPARIGGGAAKLAKATGASIVLAHTTRSGSDWPQVVLQPALFPDDFGDADDLHRRIAEMTERVYLDEPWLVQVNRQLWLPAT